MPHPSEDDLVLHYYGEADHAAHLDSCSACREQFRALQSSLNLVDTLEAPAPPANIETKVWNHIAATESIATPTGINWRWFLFPALATACLAIAFFAGRFTKAPDGVTAIAYLPQQAILRAQAAEHLERSKLVLLEIVHTDASATHEATLPRARAEELLSANRLLRRTAQSSGNARLAEMLDELERILIEIANAPDAPDAVLTNSLRARIRDQGVLFRLAITEKRITEKETENQSEVTE